MADAEGLPERDTLWVLWSLAGITERCPDQPTKQQLDALITHVSVISGVRGKIETDLAAKMGGLS